MSIHGENKSSWVIKDSSGLGPAHILILSGSDAKYKAVHEKDWVLVLNASSKAVAVGRIYRIRSGSDGTSLYFDKFHSFDCLASLEDCSISMRDSKISRISWMDFVESLPKLSGMTISDIPLIENQAYIRDLLQLTVKDDLLGPANGPHEQIIDMGVRDRYLVGKLAPMEKGDSGESWEGCGSEEEDSPEQALEIHTGAHETGAEFSTATGKVDPDSEASDQIDATNNQSLVPSSMGLTFCVDGDVESIEIEARWGRYEREYDHEIYKTRRNPETGEEVQGQKAKVWQRIPCGGTVKLQLKPGLMPHIAPDNAFPEVRVQGSVREKNANGDRLVTLFLVNAQEEPDSNRDMAWVFQPELIVRSASGDSLPIFRRRPVLTSDKTEPERLSLEMIYRNQVEFAVGHGIAVHSTTDSANPERATEIRTVVMPEYEVPVTETPGLDEKDRPAMQAMVERGYLDMKELAAMSQQDLVTALKLLADDYLSWIKDQNDRIGVDVVGHDESAKQALARCRDIQKRLLDGIDVLATNEDALNAFRFANEAMAEQRVHSLYSLEKRRNPKAKIHDFYVRKNHSWRPFQLAFILLSIPSLSDPLHRDRTSPAESFADLLWFPTGGGKTEAYLGVAAFTMAIRRLQGNLGGYDASRGLAVIMRYTLRLLTLQQFQRATALICAMEVIRRRALESGDNSLGDAAFTIGLWVGNRVTPGTTQDSHKAIEDERNPDKYNAGAASPAQLTSCPWCGSEVASGRDIEVRKAEKRTVIYCGDKKGRCDFSRGKSSNQPHPGIPVMVVDEEIYHRPPTMMIATVDKFAMMAWRGQVRTLFGKAESECPRHGLLWPDSDCTGNHQASKKNGLPKTTVEKINPIRPPDLIIQDEFHLISGPLGTMVGLYETAVDELSSWMLDGKQIKPKIVASTATVRKAKEQVNGVFMRQVSVFPPHGLDVDDNFFSVQRSIHEKPGRRYMGICSPGSSRPAMLIRVYTALLTASQGLFDRFGQLADPYMTTVGYFNSLRELGGMKRLAEDDVQTRSYRVGMSLVERPGLAQRRLNSGGIKELTSRVSNQDIPKYLDQLEVKFNAEFDHEKGRYVTNWQEGELRAIDVVLATNMLSVGVDVNRLGLMAVNGQPKGTAEYIQATSRVGRSSPGLVCSVLTWARPRDLSHYETFEHYHATFYKHVEAQSVTPFSPRAMDRGLSGAMLSMLRLENDDLNPNTGAGELQKTNSAEVISTLGTIEHRASMVTESGVLTSLAKVESQNRIDDWVTEAQKGGRQLAYEKKGPKKDTMVALIKSPGVNAWDDFTIPMSMREVEPGVRLVMSTHRNTDAHPAWSPTKAEDTSDKGAVSSSKAKHYSLSDVVSGNLVGQTVSVILPDGQGARKFSVLAKSEGLPPRNSLVIASYSGYKQDDVGIDDVAFGKLAWTELQSDTGDKQVNVKIQRRGASTSVLMDADEWNSFRPVAVAIDN